MSIIRPRIRPRLARRQAASSCNASRFPPFLFSTEVKICAFDTCVRVKIRQRSQFISASMTGWGRGCLPKFSNWFCSNLTKRQAGGFVPLNETSRGFATGLNEEKCCGVNAVCDFYVKTLVYSSPQQNFGTVLITLCIRG